MSWPFTEVLLALLPWGVVLVQACSWTLLMHLLQIWSFRAAWTNASPSLSQKSPWSLHFQDQEVWLGDWLGTSLTGKRLLLVGLCAENRVPNDQTHDSSTAPTLPPSLLTPFSSWASPRTAHKMAARVPYTHPTSPWLQKTA